MASSPFADLEALAARLPFALDDVAQVNAAFVRWRAERCPHALETVELWSYCFVRRYCLLKFYRGHASARSDQDALEARILRTVQEKRVRVIHAARYASWVSVVCRNMYYNYLRSHRVIFLSVETAGLPSVPASAPRRHDDARADAALSAAIERLPAYLQNVARLHFLGHRSYREIAELTGRPAPSVRTYVSKARTCFRRDAALRALLRDLGTPLCRRPR